MKHSTTALKIMVAMVSLATLSACAQGAPSAPGVNVETAYYSVPVPPYTRSIFNSTNF